MKGALRKTEVGYELYMDHMPLQTIADAVYPHDITRQRLSKENCDGLFLAGDGLDLEVVVEGGVLGTVVSGGLRSGEASQPPGLQVHENISYSRDKQGCLILKRVE